MTKAPDHPLKIWRLSQVPPLSQRKAAAKMGVTDMALVRWERWAVPKSQLAGKIQAVTGLSPNDFHKHLAIPARGKKRGP